MGSTLPTLLLVILAITSEHARAALTVKPSDTEVLVEGTIHLNCSTSLAKEVHWYHVPADSQSSDQKYVYYYGQLFSPYKDRFRMSKNNGSYNINITRVSLTDAGVYICQDNEGNGEVASAELVVLEAAPTCSSTMKPDGVVGVNSCNKEPETLQLSCSVSYRGKSPPLMEWRKVDGNSSITEGVTIESSGNRVTHHLTLASEPSTDGASYFCQTIKMQYICISSVIKIIYAVGSNAVQKAKIGDTVICKANASQSCTYKWKWFHRDDILTVSNNQTLVPKRSGNFRCEAECFIKKSPCIITAMLAYVEGGNATSEASNTSDANLASGFVALIVICIILLLGAIIVFSVVYLLRKRRRTSKQQVEGANGDIWMEETDRLLQTLAEGSGDIDFSKLTTRLPYIDKGSSGEVHGPCQFQKRTCAFQRILFSPTKLMDDMEREILEKGNNWKKLEHTNIIKFYVVHFERPALYIFMDYAAGGTVRKTLDLCTEDLSPDVVSNWSLQIANGMNYLHANDTIHKHLKSAQILIMEPFDATHPSHKTLKIASYRLTTEAIQSAPGSFKGMFAWASPETIQEQKYSRASDVWSYGVTVWEVLMREIPYKGNKHGEIIAKVLDGNKGLTIPSSCSIVLRDLLKDCWTIEPEKRPKFPNIVSRLNDITGGKLNVSVSDGRANVSISDVRAIPQRITDMNYIDKGASGEIYGPFLFQGNKCACERIMHPPSIPESNICDESRRWMELDHEHVLKFYDVLFETPTLYVVMDYAEGGSVRMALDSCPEDLEVNVVWDWARQIAEGMNYLHTKGILHKRLKTAQVLIMEQFDPSNPSHKTLKIGSCRLSMDSGQLVPMSFKGMFAWTAPEAIKGEQICKASDVWSYGVTVWEILTKEIPHKKLKQGELIRNLMDGSLTLDIPSRCPKEIHDVLQECWSMNMKNRPTFSDILSRLNTAVG